ncbi:DNA polymerase III subunit delta [Carnobacterium sp. 17-4]|nr:DNA polymerase III subunit delta [Carnobacterium sp. 17-4]
MKWLESYLTHPSESTTLVFFAPYEKLDERKKITKLLKKTATIIEVNALSEKDMRKYIKDTIANEEYRYSPEAFELFIQLTDAKLSVAMGELPKLFIYAQDTKFITLDAVQELVAKSLEQNIFALNEYVLKKDVGQALNLYQDLLLQKEDPIKINAIMTSQFRLLIQVKILEKKGYQQGDIAKQLKTHPYRVKLAIQQMRKIEEHSLIEAYNGLIDAEYRLKTGKGDKEMQFELFVLQYAQKKATNRDQYKRLK